MSSHSLNLCGILSETKRIINAHSRHFLALSLLFVLPLPFSFIFYPSVTQPTSILSSYSLIPDSQTSSGPKISSFDESRILFNVLYCAFAIILSLFATASITQSTFHGFYGRPVKLVSSLKCVLFSFFPLLVTLIVSLLGVATVCAAYGCVVMLIYNGLSLIGVEMDYESGSFTVFVAAIFVLLAAALLCIQVEWNLSSVVVVVESKWGISPLKRSSRLIKGMKTVALCMIILFGLLLGIWSKLCWILMPNGGGISEGWIGWGLIIVLTVLYAASMTLTLLYSIAANTVLYMYCKAMQGELAVEIAEEFAREYVSLPFDDGKVPHTVYVV